MGVEVKGAGDGVVIADRGCNDGCGYRDHSGWGSGWGAVGGALVGGGFGAAVTSRMDNRKSNVSLRTLQRTRRLPV
ncbi:MAG: hypothetical protein [Bacteriophage sp.]|nr:MAG: hypothetical protein [Bacteriophage sp.]UWG08548.1 MAG: hypothetical protein [Bacteriophage sp.]